MSPLPEHLIDRWQTRPEADQRRGVLYWHILLGDHAQVRAVARSAQARLSGFNGLHMTPLKWLHITTLAVGSVDNISQAEMIEMVAKATLALSKTPRVRVSLEDVFYHPEAIGLIVRPSNSLGAVFDVAQSITSTVLGKDRLKYSDLGSWKPHMTICYSTCQQPAKPVISALGRKLPTCETTIDSLSLVVQRGQERLWDWHPVGRVPLSGRQAPE